ncbi:MAG: YiiX/YebB-like N1pC/P60 family cysteine hydrolase [Gammaproteobacteria bacterium]
MATAISEKIGKWLAAYLSKSIEGYRRLDTIAVEDLADVLQPGDVVLVEGNTRISIAIKYLTQSSWSHACLFVGEAGSPSSDLTLLEADLQNGVRLVAPDHYRDLNLRICRPNKLSDEDRSQLLEFSKGKLGHHYDLKNVVDLIRYLIQKPAVPQRYRRAMIAFGSGEPTRAICSTLIAESFQSIGYPILPIRSDEGIHDPAAEAMQDAVDESLDEDAEIVGEKGEVPVYYKRHFTHFTPRDFDLSPYFQIIKPTLERGFDYRKVKWGEAKPGASDNAQ